MKKKYLKPEQCVLEMPTSTLLVASLQGVNTTNLSDDEKIGLGEDAEDDFWGR